MKKISIKILFLFIITSSVCGQSKDLNIRFIHGGEELKPVGTLAISTKTILKPNDRESDKFFGRGVKTDIHSFKALKTFIEQCSYLVKDSTQLKGSNEWFTIKYSDGLRFYLKGNNLNIFFPSLRVFLKKQNTDTKLIKAFEYF